MTDIIFGCYIPVYHSLKFLFEVPGVYNETAKHVANLLNKENIICMPITYNALSI